MMNTFKKVLLFVLVVITPLIVFVSWKPVQDDKGLKDYFTDYYRIGVATPRWFLREGEPNDLIKKHFNSLTSENDMKWQNIHPQEDEYNFEVADQLVEFGQANDMFIVGHTLVWHSQLARWVLKPVPTGDPAKDTLLVDAATLEKRIVQHIETIVGRYKGKIGGWDVVNEALNEDGSYRPSAFYNILGEDFIPLAFTTAAKVDPDAELYYNDYNLVNRKKREGALRIVKMLQEKGVKIDGVGIQAHWSLETPSIEEIEQSILDYSALGVDVMFTELDVSVLPSPWRMPSADISIRFKNNPTMNPYPDSLPDSMQVKLADRYQQIFELFNKHKDKITRVTFWGLHDGVSWKNGFPIRGRTDYPLLFDRKLQPKKAYDAVVEITTGD